MKIGLFTEYDRNFLSVAEVTMPPLQRYAAKHGYSLQVQQDPIQPRGIIWQRCSQLYVCSGSYPADWLGHFDTDVLVTNPDFDLAELLGTVPPEKCVVVSEDANGINDGTIFFRNSEEGEIALATLWATDKSCMQDALSHRLTADPQMWGSLVEFVPQKAINSYHYPEYGLPETTPGQWQPGDFVLHLPGCTNQRRVEIFNRILSENS